MKKRIISLITLCAMFAFSSMQAQEKEKVEQLNEVVVSATKFKISKEKVGKIIYQIKKEDLENLKGLSVIDVLDNIAGIQINGANNASGKNKSTYIRGGRDRQVLVLIDGVPVSDPSGINTTFDLRLLTLSQVESIEVMNGAASTLYGSGAATGVVNIKLKEASKKDISLNYQTSIGTNNSQKDTSINVHELNQNASVNGTLNKFSYLGTVNISKTDGLSEASDAKSSTRFEKDAFKTTNTFVKLSYALTNNLNLQLFNNYDSDIYTYDNGQFSDSDINNGANKQVRSGIASNFKYKNGSLKFVASYNKVNRILESYNSWTSSINNSKYTGETEGAELVNDYQFSPKFQLITGVNYQKQKNQTNTDYGVIEKDIANYTTIDPYASFVYNSASGFNLNAGARLNNHSEYGNHVVYNVNPSFNVTNNLKIISSYSTAFIAPSTYQLFSQYGNVNLDPEENKSIEAGLVFNKHKFVEWNAVYFYREEKNAIILPTFVTYENAANTIYVRGAETELKIEAIKDVTFKLGYTYLNKSEDVDYIPKSKFTAVVETSALKNSYLSLRYKSVGARTYFDQWGTGEDINIDAYNLFDFYASHTLIKSRLSVFAQVSNILNEDFVETIGYSTKGRNFKIGLDFKF